MIYDLVLPDSCHVLNSLVPDNNPALKINGKGCVGKEFYNISQLFTAFLKGLLSFFPFGNILDNQMKEWLLAELDGT